MECCCFVVSPRNKRTSRISAVRCTLYSILLSAGNNETENVAHFLFSLALSSHGRLLRLRAYGVLRSIRLPLALPQYVGGCSGCVCVGVVCEAVAMFCQ